MDQPSAPWRALESEPAGVAPDPDGGGRPSRSSPPILTAVVIGAAALLAAVAIWLVVSSGRGSVVVDGDASGAGGSSDPAIAARPSGAGRLVVDVQGAVVRPGIVGLPTGSRVGDAIAAAGGFGPRVASDRVGRSLNLAALVHDGDQIVVPSRDEPGAGTGAGGSSPPGDGGGGRGSPSPVDLNHATAEQLDALPGVGPATAAKIIAAREEQPFATVDELRSRKIVGAATFEKLRELVTVR